MDDQSCILLAKPNTGDYYEGNGAFLRGIRPRPNISKAEVCGFSKFQSVVFREDSYDPTTRTRRGRFYAQVAPVQLPQSRVSHDLLLTLNMLYSPFGSIIEFQFTFSQEYELNIAIASCKDYGILIGVPPAKTSWRVIDAEALSDGTTLFTLKALSSGGLLPVLNTELQKVKDAAESVADAIKYSPVPIVDVCRESSRAVIATKVDHGDMAKDLAKISDAIERKGYVSAALAGKIIARLHSRGKSSEREQQAKHGKPIRPVLDEDALLALQLFGFILTDLGYTKT